jgi:hypothetical protein
MPIPIKSNYKVAFWGDRQRIIYPLFIYRNCEVGIMPYENLRFENHLCSAVCEHCGKRCILHEGHGDVHCHPPSNPSSNTYINTPYTPKKLPPGVRETPYYCYVEPKWIRKAEISLEK